MSSGTLGNKKQKGRYNYQHIYFVSKKRKGVFRKQKTIDACREGLYEAADRFGIQIRELGFGEDFAHVHIIVNIPSSLSVEQTIQILKSHASTRIFEKVPNFLKLYPDREFWSGWRYNGSIGPMTEFVVKRYIQKQDITQKKISDFNRGKRR
ncbi:MAG: IS200/IS605 family transposase [Nanoarchaeota archaeon]|nr:MAG: IS200/IS605 family transposase [Nanoarchaeota archaeon]